MGIISSRQMSSFNSSHLTSTSGCVLKSMARRTRDQRTISFMDERAPSSTTRKQYCFSCRIARLMAWNVVAQVGGESHKIIGSECSHQGGEEKGSLKAGETITGRPAIREGRVQPDHLPFRVKLRPQMKIRVPCHVQVSISYDCQA
jgi:hypothetical protein